MIKILSVLDLKIINNFWFSARLLCYVQIFVPPLCYNLLRSSITDTPSAGV